MRSALAAIVLTAACAHSNAPEPTEADASRSGANLDDLVSGRRLYVGHCGSCHLPRKPSEHTATEWPMHVSEMRDRAGLSFDEARLVERYLIAMSSR